MPPWVSPWTTSGYLRLTIAPLLVFASMAGGYGWPGPTSIRETTDLPRSPGHAHGSLRSPPRRVGPRRRLRSHQPAAAARLAHVDRDRAVPPDGQRPLEHQRPA